MVRRIDHQVIDDLDGTSLPEAETETIRFGLDGKIYEIDLSLGNAQQMRKAVAPFIAAARRQAERPSSSRRNVRKT